MTLLPTHLSNQELAAITTLGLSLRHVLGDDLYHLWLFGSKARGDFSSDSDVDLLIILSGLTPQRRGAIRRLAARTSLDYNILINTHLYEKARWQGMVERGETLWREVQRDGVPLGELLTEPVS